MRSIKLAVLCSFLLGFAAPMLHSHLLIADGGKPAPKPWHVADGGKPLPKPWLMADGGKPLPKPWSAAAAL
jgi:hypothetical protein